MALAVKAIALVGIAAREDVSAALESILIGRESDRAVFRALFDAYFDAGAGGSPDRCDGQGAAREALADDASRERRRILDAIPRWSGHQKKAGVEHRIQFDGPMTASHSERLRHADFGTLEALEYRDVQRMARDITIALPARPGRRYRKAQGCKGGERIDWPGAVQESMRTGGELMRLPRSKRTSKTLPVLVLVDVSGSMERYARILLSFLHAALPLASRRDVFVFGTHLTDLTRCFERGDIDDMLLGANASIDDFAGGTRIGGSLGELRRHYGHRLVGGRTIAVLVTDGLETGSPEALGNELQWLRRRARRLLWLNPMMRFEGYAPAARGASALHKHAHAMLAAYNLATLEQLAEHLARLFIAVR